MPFRWPCARRSLRGAQRRRRWGDLPSPAIDEQLPGCRDSSALLMLPVVCRHLPPICKSSESMDMRGERREVGGLRSRLPHFTALFAVVEHLTHVRKICPDSTRFHFHPKRRMLLPPIWYRLHSLDDPCWSATCSRRQEGWHTGRGAEWRHVAHGADGGARAQVSRHGAAGAIQAHAPSTLRSLPAPGTVPRAVRQRPPGPACTPREAAVPHHRPAPATGRLLRALHLLAP
jgi:hypothetical protein